MVKFGGYLEMKKLINIKFTYEDNTSDEIIYPRACLLFQSRFNSSGIISGLETYFVSSAEKQNDESIK